MSGRSKTAGDELVIQHFLVKDCVSHIQGLSGIGNIAILIDRTRGGYIPLQNIH